MTGDHADDDDDGCDADCVDDDDVSDNYDNNDNNDGVEDDDVIDFQGDEDNDWQWWYLIMMIYDNDAYNKWNRYLRLARHKDNQTSLYTSTSKTATRNWDETAQSVGLL